MSTKHAGYTGTGFVDTVNNSTSYMQWQVNAANAGPATLGIRYALGASARTASLIVNGATVISSLSFPGTGAWTNWATQTVTVSLQAGANTIRLKSLTSASCPKRCRRRSSKTALQGPVWSRGSAVSNNRWNSDRSASRSA